MKKRYLFLPFVALVVGCSGEPAPTIGDAEISKGIARKPMPKPPQGSSSMGLTSRDVNQMRKR